MLRIAILDNHFIYRKGLAFMLGRHFPKIVIKEAKPNINIITDLLPFQPNLIMMHLDNIHERDGFNQALRLTEAIPDAPLIIYEDHTNYNKALKALRANVSGYLAMGCDEDEIIRCVHTVFSGKNYLCANIQQRIIEQVVQRKIPLKTQGYLSLRESEIARLISEGEKTSGIALMLGLKSSTVSTVKATVFAKLGVRNVLELRSKMMEI
jgi:DNA-binding NarL/FixJ family response regulator